MIPLESDYKRTNDTMFKSLINLFRPTPHTVREPEVLLDPHGIAGRQMVQIKKYCGTGKYKVGDTIESVAYRQAQLDLIDFIETKLIANPSKF